MDQTDRQTDRGGLPISGQYLLLTKHTSCKYKLNNTIIKMRQTKMSVSCPKQTLYLCKKKLPFSTMYKDKDNIKTKYYFFYVSSNLIVFIAMHLHSFVFFNPHFTFSRYQIARPSHNSLTVYFQIAWWLFSSFRRQTKCTVCNVVCFLLGNYPASGVYMPIFRNTLSVPSL